MLEPGPLSADPDLGYVHLPMEAATGDFYGGHRPGDNLYSVLWFVWMQNRYIGLALSDRPPRHLGLWSSCTSSPGRSHGVWSARKAVIQSDQTSICICIERTHGQPTFGRLKKPVPQSSIPGENPSPTQPFPTRPDPFWSPGLLEDILVDFTRKLKSKRKQLRQNMIRGQYTIRLLSTIPGSTGDTGHSGCSRWRQLAGSRSGPGNRVLYVSSSTVLRPMSLEHGDERTGYGLHGIPRQFTDRSLWSAIGEASYGRITSYWYERRRTFVDGGQCGFSGLD